MFLGLFVLVFFLPLHMWKALQLENVANSYDMNEVYLFIYFFYFCGNYNILSKEPINSGCYDIFA